MNFMIVSFYFFIAFWLSPLYGQQLDENQPVLYYADSQTYDRELGILILKGHVEFDHQGNILEADFVTYNEKADIITASGNVRLRQSNGDINFADYLELTGDMKQGIILQLRTLLADNSKIAALEGRKCENRQELDQAVYTPCELCKDRLPTWQLNARRAIKEDKDITFTDVEFRLLDVPLLYFPYATQPLERRSGFLLPIPGFAGEDFGVFLQIPYYFAISEDKDLTLTPVFFAENNPLLLGDYRQAFGNGILNIEGSITEYKKSKKDKKLKHEIPDTRGHIFGDLKLNLTDIWRLDLEGGVFSDKTYARKYKLSGWQNENALTSKAILEGFLNQRDYAAVKAYHFQGLRVDLDHQKHISAPLPMVEYSAYSDVDSWGGRFQFDGNLLNLYREEGINLQRGIGELGWKRPINTPIGQIFTFFSSIRGDLYNVEDSHEAKKRKKEKNPDTHHSKNKKGGARFFPQAGLHWRWPFIKSFCEHNIVIQPIAQLIVAPNEPIGADNREIPNEDSVDFEFNDANLFSPDRFPGYDRIDEGSRFVYGGEILSTGQLFGDIELFLGQSYSLSDQDHHGRHHHNNNRHHHKNKKFQDLKPRASDYVGRILVTPYSWLSFNYRFRLDHETFDSRIAEAGASLGPAIARFSGTYLFMSKHATIKDHSIQTPHQNFNQISLNFSSQFTTHWSVFANIIKNLEKTKGRKKKDDHDGILEEGIGLLYRDDCFGLGITATREFYQSADIKPTTTFLITLFLKNIGDFSTSINLNGGIFGNQKESNQ